MYRGIPTQNLLVSGKVTLLWESYTYYYRRRGGTGYTPRLLTIPDEGVAEEDFLYAPRRLTLTDLQSKANHNAESCTNVYKFKMKGGYRDGLKHQKGRNKGHYTAKVHKAT